jgi:hypothetical protein
MNSITLILRFFTGSYFAVSQICGDAPRIKKYITLTLQWIGASKLSTIRAELRAILRDVQEVEGGLKSSSRDNVSAKKRKTPEILKVHRFSLSRGGLGT